VERGVQGTARGGSSGLAARRGGIESQHARGEPSGPGEDAAPSMAEPDLVRQLLGMLGSQNAMTSQRAKSESLQATSAPVACIASAGASRAASAVSLPACTSLAGQRLSLEELEEVLCCPITQVRCKLPSPWN